MSLESPPRLKHGELGPILDAADLPVSPERLASNQAAIKTAIAAGVVKTWPLWMKLGLPLLLVIGGYAIYRGVTPDAPEVVQVATPVTPAADAAIAVAPDAAVIDPVIADAAEVTIDAAVAAAPRKRPIVDEPAPPDAAPALPPSDLPAQIALYEDARAAAAKGELARGIGLLDELLRRFPSTPLRAEAELTRAELLTRANRLDDAAAALEVLVASAAHRGRRGELLRALGDIRRKQGDCPRAVDAYTRAREARLNAAETVKVERGLERCAGPR